jgi:hypothetical protein
MSDEIYLVKTKSGSLYYLRFQSKFIGKDSVTIDVKGEPAIVTGVTESEGIAEIAEKHQKNEFPKPTDLKPGKIIHFESKKDRFKGGHTTRIAEVYKRVA